MTIRIIPAHAGNTGIMQIDSGYFGDHPRACGEHVSTSFFQPSLPGSSPRMRGTPNQPPIPAKKPGIIPAHAGNTEHHATIGWFHGDHPRACGEHLFG